MSWSASTPTTCRSTGRARSTPARDRARSLDLGGGLGRPCRYRAPPLHQRLFEHLKRSPKLFMDETRAPVLDPGHKRTKTGYLWVIARDDRPGRVPIHRRSPISTRPARRRALHQTAGRVHRRPNYAHPGPTTRGVRHACSGTRLVLLGASR
jgi:hypothetical protein